MVKSAQSYFPPHSGFTLIELMVVISIIAILATVGLTIYSAAQKSARDGKRVSDILEIQKALEQYYAVNNAYPPALSSANSYFENSAPPTDPINSGSYNYIYQHCPTSEQYNVCDKLETSGKGDSSAEPGDGCTAYSPGTTYYCASQLSN